MKTLRDIPHLEGVKVLLRADFNAPIRNGAVVDDFRISAALPTIDFLRKKGAKVILVSHLEANDGEKTTLQPVADTLKKLGVPVIFIQDYKKADSIIESRLTSGECVLLENLRSFDGEKNNDEKFAQELASLADIYVNDAFPVCHRQHASIVGVPNLLPGYAGLQLEKEVTNLSKAFKPPHPFLFILGGAKFETKLPLLSKFMEIADHVFVGGALANDLFKAKGYEIGTSLFSASSANFGPFLKSPKLMMPVDVIDQQGKEKMADGLAESDKIMDAGPRTLESLAGKIADAKFILWNGPLGMYENGYTGPTMELARLISRATGRGAETIVGGGDTLAAIATLGLAERFTFMSTGGGAMLEFLAKGTLPGIQALNDSEKRGD